MSAARLLARCTLALCLLVAPIIPAYAAAPAGVVPQDATAREVLRAIHTDALHATFTDGELGLRTRVGSGADTRVVDPDSVVFNLEDLPAARAEVPDHPAYGFLGAPGQQLWIAPEVQESSILWPGWDTEEVGSGVLEDDTLDLTLRSVDGPGRLEVFTSSPTGEPQRIFSSAADGPRTRHQRTGSHVHANWVFTALGSYTLTFVARGVTAAGQEVSSEAVELLFVVGEYQSATPTSTVLQADPNPAGAGQPVTMTGTVTPASAAGSVEFRDGEQLLGAAPIADGAATVRSSGLEPGHHQLTARFVPADPAAFEPSASSVVDLLVDPATPSPTPTSTPTPSPTPTPTPSPTPTAPRCVDVVLDDGHVDVAARTAGGALRTLIKDGTRDPVVWRDPDRVAFHVRPAARVELPDDPVFGFLGRSGAPVWVIPQDRIDGVIWAGWNTEEVDYAALDGPVTFSIDQVRGPGKVALFAIDAFGQPIHYFRLDRPYSQHLPLPEPTHAHSNWAFTAEGIYHLTFSHTATTRSGQRLHDTGTLAVAVGNVNLADLCPGGSVPTPSPSPSSSPTPSISPTSRPSPSPTPSAPPTSPAPSTPPAAPRGAGPAERHCVPAASPATTAPASVPTSSGTSPPAAPAGPAVTLDDGHVDYAVRLEGSALQSRIKDGTVAGRVTWRDPSAVRLNLTAATRIAVPSAPSFGFLGTPGAQVWQIPQTQKPGALWLGWNTEELTSAQVRGDIGWRLDRVDGPGKLAVFTFDTFGQPRVLFDSRTGVPDTMQVHPGTHAHGNWAFTKAGTYHVRFTHTAVLASGNRVSDTATVTFVVGSASGGSAGHAAVPAARAGGVPMVADVVRAGVTGAVCRLAQTGSAIGPGWISGGALLLVAGTVALVAAHRRRVTAVVEQSLDREPGGTA